MKIKEVSLVETRRSRAFGAGRPREAERRGLTLSGIGDTSRRDTTGREGTIDRVEISLRKSGRPVAEKVEV